MISETEAKDLMSKLNRLKLEAKENKEIETELNKHLNLCMEKFKYLVTMRTGRYKAYNNYDDLNQEGFEALLRAMKTYNPKKGSFFSWAHNYISTKISRSANLHSTIRYPMKVAKELPPHKELGMPEMIDEGLCPSDSAELNETNQAVRDVLPFLTKRQREVIMMSFGIGEENPMSVNKICSKLEISRDVCIDILNKALKKMRKKIKI